MVKSSQYKAYTTATRTVAKTRQIVMLYDGAIRFLKQAQVAIDENRIEDRFNLLKRASDVMMGLQSCIDFENGGKMAHVLLNFYATIANRMLMVNFDRKNAKALCQGIIDEIKQMRDVWDQIDQSMATAQEAVPAVETPVTHAAAIPASGKAPVTVSA